MSSLRPTQDWSERPKEDVITEATTAVLVLLPDAEPLLDRIRQLAPELVRPLPAHVSLLYPGPDPTPAVMQEVRELGSDLPGEVELTEWMTGDEGFLGIAVPDLDPVLARLRERYPQALPYRGRFGAAPRAHLTLALGAASAQAHAAEQAVAAALPRRSRVRGPYVVQRTDEGWRPVSDPG